MVILPLQETILNIRYDAPDEVWEKISRIYEKMPGWLGFASNNIPYWFSEEEDGSNKMVCASVEPAGLQLNGYMNHTEWEPWIETFKELASKELSFNVGDVRDGFV